MGETDRANRTTQSIQVDAFDDPIATTVDHMTVHTPKCVFNESKRKSLLRHMYYNVRFCWKLSVCFTR